LVPPFVSLSIKAVLILLRLKDHLEILYLSHRPPMRLSQAYYWTLNFDLWSRTTRQMVADHSVRTASLKREMKTENPISHS